MNDINNKKIEAGDIIYYGKYSMIQEGRVIRVSERSIVVSCGRGKTNWRDMTFELAPIEKAAYCLVIDNVPLKDHNGSKRLNIWVRNSGITNQIVIKRKRRR